MMDKPKANNKVLGKKGEDIALEYMVAQGYEIVGRNSRPGKVEVDILATKDDVIAVVEVKSRKSALIHPSRSVDGAKRARLAHAARALSETYPSKSIRFDVISIIICAGKYEIEYLPDAFRPGGSFKEESF
jgi:putative endonuclease